MKVNILHDKEGYQDWVHIRGDYEQFHIWGNHEDYVEDTKVLMQIAATRIFEFPFYIHFEGYEDDIESILQMRDQFEITYQSSGRTVFTMSGFKAYRAEIPSFTVTIRDRAALQKVFDEWFDLAFQNCMWLITKNPNLYYENNFASIDMKQESSFLLADHDAYGFSLISNDSFYHLEANLQRIFNVDTN